MTSDCTMERMAHKDKIALSSSPATYHIYRNHHCNSTNNHYPQELLLLKILIVGFHRILNVCKSYNLYDSSNVASHKKLLIFQKKRPNLSAKNPIQRIQKNGASTCKNMTL